MFLRQSTSQVILFGPCLDKTDGVTEETGLTLAQGDMRLSKDGGAFAQKNASGNATHDSDGWYATTFDTTDTATVGILKLNVHQPANMLPVWETFYIVEENIYDAIFGASAALGTDLASILTDTGTTLPALLPTALVSGRIDADVGAKTGNVALSAQEKLDVNTEADTALTDYDAPTKTEMDTAHALLATPAQVNTEVDSAFTTSLADSVPSDGTIPTREQALYMTVQFLLERAVSSTTVTVKKVDGSTTLMTLTLDDATNPTSITRAT